jgi:hypothetical protein
MLGFVTHSSLWSRAQADLDNVTHTHFCGQEMDHKCADHVSASTDTALFADFVHMVAAQVRTCAGKERRLCLVTIGVVVLLLGARVRASRGHSLSGGG